MTLTSRTRSMVSVEKAKKEAAKLYERRWRQWYVDGGTGAEFNLVLHPPTERDVLGDPAPAIAWAQLWRDAGLGDSVEWAERRWPSAGTQRVPVRLRLTDAGGIASFAGTARHWTAAGNRLDGLVDRWTGGGIDIAPDTFREALHRDADAIARLPAADATRLGSVVSWFLNNPDSGLYVRQIPVHGVDSKWLGTHRGLVARFVAALTERDDLGLTSVPARIRLRILDDQLLANARVPRDLEAPLSDINALALQPEMIFIFENLESVIAMEPVPGAIVVHGAGFAVNLVGLVPWIAGGRIVYWGDLDSAGFAILNRLRSTEPNVTSVLMDDATLDRHADLIGPDPKPVRGALQYLTTDERATLDRLRDGDLRLEQERVDWSYAMERLSAASLRAGGCS